VFLLYLELICQFRFDITLIELNQLFIHSKSGIVFVQQKYSTDYKYYFFIYNSNCNIIIELFVFCI